MNFRGVNMVNPNDIKHLFDNWDDGLILSYLQGHMGYVVADDEKFPKSAQIVLGDFCFVQEFQIKN